MPVYHSKGTVLLILLGLYPALSAAVNFSQCFADVITCAEDSSNCTLGISNTTALSILRTSQGQNVTSTDAATGLSYTGCTTYCGTGLEQFSWTFFAEQYAAWLLPYLSLISQLPFGAPRRMDNLMSALLTLGSPVLAGYSLYMTLLNARWVNDQLFAGVDYPNVEVRRSVVRVLNSLQQVPIRIHPGGPAGFEQLVVHTDYDKWWKELAEGLDSSHMWSIASATSIAWVVIAYLFTVADSIYTATNNIESNGQGTGSGWVWLFPIVVGWLIVSPQSNHKRVHHTYRKATAHTHLTPDFALEIIDSQDPDSSDGGDIISPDELRIPPVFNYARVFSWYQNVYIASLFYRAAWRRKSKDRAGVDGSRIPGNVHDDTPLASRSGTCDQIIQYCRPDRDKYTRTRVLWPCGLFANMIVASFMSLQLQWGTTGAAFLVVWFSPTTGLGCRSVAYLLYGVTSTIVWMLLVSSSVLGYFAHYLLWDLPILDLEGNGQSIPPDVPCKPSSHEPIGNLSDDSPGVSSGHSTLAVPLVETCAPLEREKSQPDTKPRPGTSFATDKCSHFRRRTAHMMLYVADWLRWTGKALAILNAINIIANSVFQYAGVYASCYCDSSVFSWGALAFNVINPNSSDINMAQKAWIGGLALALSCCSIFVGSIFLVRDALA